MNTRPSMADIKRVVEEVNKMTEEIKEICSQGARVELISMDDPCTRLKPGNQGTVICVDDIGTIHVAWDNGEGLGLVLGQDKFKIVRSSGDITNEELLIDVFCVPSEGDKVCRDLAGWKMDKEGKCWCERFCGKINDGESPDMTCYKEWLKMMRE